MVEHLQVMGKRSLHAIMNTAGRISQGLRRRSRSACRGLELLALLLTNLLHLLPSGGSKLRACKHLVRKVTSRPRTPTTSSSAWIGMACQDLGS